MLQLKIHDFAPDLKFRAGQGRRKAGFHRSRARSGWPINTTPMDTYMGPERMEKGVARW